MLKWNEYRKSKGKDYLWVNRKIEGPIWPWTFQNSIEAKKTKIKTTSSPRSEMVCFPWNNIFFFIIQGIKNKIKHKNNVVLEGTNNLLLLPVDHGWNKRVFNPFWGANFSSINLLSHTWCRQKKKKNCYVLNNL